MEKKINHISFIMDGNGRWAKKRGLPRNAGHKAGVEKAKEIVNLIKEIGIPYVSMYTFSKENWSRPKLEVSFLMDLILYNLEKDFKFYTENEIKVVHVGDKNGLPSKVVKAIEKVQNETSGFDKITVLLAINYSGKYDILQAINKINKNSNKIVDITDEMISSNLLTASYPDPDLIIRTSGEFRISNYFLWQSAYSEFFITDKYWPDLKKEDVLSMIDSYYIRDRRFGGIKNE